MDQEKQKADLIKSALLIIDKISKIDLDKHDPNMEKIINDCKKLTKNILWKLK